MNTIFAAPHGRIETTNETGGLPHDGGAGKPVDAASLFQDVWEKHLTMRSHTVQAEILAIPGGLCWRELAAEVVMEVGL